jgi:cation diffusion facilitator CzcD-associated flavoprotein CzcO
MPAPPTDSSGNGRPARDFRVLVVGAGFSGLGAAIRLKQAGIHDFVVLERADDLGGTWRDNDYPGCCCDIPSHVYSYSFELNPEWTRGFASHAEIKDYMDRTAQKYGALPHIRYGHEVLELRWDAGAQRWEVDSTGGRFTAQFVIVASGPLSDPIVPLIPGLSEFEGKTFHSAHWDHDHVLAGERVAVIGTGASAIQFVPAIQPEVKKLHLFQRTAPWVVPRLDHRITRPEHFLLRHIPFAPALVRAVLYWLLEVRLVLFRRPNWMQRVDALARTHLKRQVPDPELRRKLTPGYIMGCKRILIADDYYPSVVQPNVEVRTDGVNEIRPRSLVTGDGTEIDVDTIIFGTGFHVIDAPIANKIRDGDGRTLAEVWNGTMEAYKGTTIAGFPNLFYMLGPNTGLGHNSIIFMIESQLNYVMDCLRTMEESGASSFEVRADAVRRYNERLHADMQGTVWTAGHCKSWYLDDTGRNATLWPGWTFVFRRRTKRFDAHAYVLRYGKRPAGVPAAAG